MIAGRAGNLFQAIRHIRLGAKVELHVRIHRETVEAFLADASPIPVRLHEPAIDTEAGLLADGTFDRRQPLFDFFWSNGHGMSFRRLKRLCSIATVEFELQPEGRSGLA